MDSFEAQEIFLTTLDSQKLENFTTKGHSIGGFHDRGVEELHGATIEHVPTPQLLLELHFSKSHF